MKISFVKYRTILLTTAFVVCLASALVVSKIHFNYTEDGEGVFLLKGEHGYWIEITDDLFPELAHRLVWGRPFTFFKDVISVNSCIANADSCINYEWNDHSGRGFIKNNFPDGRKLLICLSRFNDSGGLPSKGIFVGGNLPEDNPDYLEAEKNETGMAYFDGKRWFHIWCNVNEGMAPAVNPTAMSFPAQWEFLGSRVLDSDARHLALNSSHRALINGVPLIIDKILFYEAGNSFFTMVTKITNIGREPTGFYYAYGDEPWLGDFGSSAGNVGWLKGQIVTTETIVDTKTNTFVGMFDYGNPLAGEKHENFTWTANFIEWDVGGSPDMAYFSNMPRSGTTNANVPLNSPDSRFVGLQWGPRYLKPRESFTFTLAIGMAANNPISKFPVKPDTHLN